MKTCRSSFEPGEAQTSKMTRRATTNSVASSALSTSNAAEQRNNEEKETQLQCTRTTLVPLLNSDDYRALPSQLKLGVVHLLSEVLTIAESPHTSNHVMADIQALTSYGAQYLTMQNENNCSFERLEDHKRRHDAERRRLDAKAKNLVMTWRCQRFPMGGMPPLALNTNRYIIPEVQALRITGGSGSKAVAEVNEDALRIEVQRYSKELRRRVESRQHELARELQRKQREQLDMKERRKLGFRRDW